MIGSLGAATVSFLSGVLSRFREEHPLVEISLSQMNNRAQIEAVLNGSIMLGIGYFSYGLRRGRGGAGIHSIATSFACCNRSPEKSTATKRSGSKAERLSSREIPIRRPGICVWVRAMVASIANNSVDLNQKLLPQPIRRTVLSGWWQRDAVFFSDRRLASAEGKNPGDRRATSMC